MGERTALGHLRICDFTGQLAGAGATKWLAGFGADVIRIEDPVTEGRWDIMRTIGPFVDERRGVDLSGAFNNHNVGKWGITLNLRTDKAKELLRRIIEQCDVVTENFAAGVLERMGFGWPELQEIKPDIIYVSNCGFGHSGPYRTFKTWGPIVQAHSGLAFSTGLPDMDPAGYGFSFMDHHGGTYMATAILAAVLYRNRTGKGQWIDLAAVDAAAFMVGPDILDGTVNNRPLRRPGMPNANRSAHPARAPHGVYRCADEPTDPAEGVPDGTDSWVAIACADDAQWAAMATLTGLDDARFADLAGRLAHEDELDAAVTAWTRARDRRTVAATLQSIGVASSIVARPVDRIDHDADTAAWGLFPTVQHREMGEVRVDGLPVRLSDTDWRFERSGPVLGQHNVEVFGRLLGMSADEVAALKAEGVL